METIYINTMDELDKLLYDHPFDKNIGRHRDLYVYRGLSDANYSLLTSLQRICKSKKKEVESSLLNNFAKYAELENASIKDSVWRKMMLGQHHGLPTRLLDWSKSPMIALHFATSEGNMDNLDRHDCVVWRLDVTKLHNNLPEKYKSEMKSSCQKIFSIDMINRVCDSLDQYDEDMGSSKMVIIEPPSMDARMMNQFSYFSIIPSGVERVEDILDNNSDAVTKFIISKNLRWEIRDFLDMSNINERVVYPGLDGIASWLSRHYYVRNTGRLHIEKADLTGMDVDAIVNSTNKKLLCAGKICKRVFEKAGMQKMEDACRKLAPVDVGEIAVTDGFELKARKVIHAVAPEKDTGDDTISEQLLRLTYENSLEYLMHNKLHSIAFPLLGSGHNGFSKYDAFRIGLEECSMFIKQNEGYPLDISFCVIDENSYIIGQNQLNAINGEDYRLPEINGDYDRYMSSRKRQIKAQMRPKV